jgi:signal transduction histidine kinase/nitrate/nitrite-specific signal transduction histidine kinase
MVRPGLKSLRARLLVLALLVVMPALVLVLHTGMRRLQGSARDAQEETLRLARLISADQGRLLDSTRQLLMALARVPVVRDGDPAGCEALFAGLLEQYPSYAGLTAATPDGSVFCSAPPVAEPVGFADRAWFQQVIQTNDFAVGGYLIGRLSGLPVIVLGYPVHDAAGQLQAVVAAELDLTWFNELVAEAELPAGSALTVLDHDGTVLARHPDPQGWVGRAVPEVPLVEAVLAQGEGTLETEGVDGVLRLYGFTQLGGRPETGASVTVGVPTEVVYAEANRALALNLAGVGVTLLATGMIGGLFGELFVLRPARAVVGATQRFAAGDLSARTGLSDGVGELGQLGRAFDQMAEALQERNEQRDRAEAETQRRRAQLEAVREVGLEIGAQLDLDRLLHSVVTRAIDLLDGRAGGFYLHRPERNELERAVTIGPGLSPVGTTLGRGEGLFGKVWETGQPIAVDDYERWEGRAPIYEGHSLGAVVGVPVRSGEEFLGVLNVLADPPRRFSQADVELMSLFATQAAIAIKNAQLFQAEREQRALAERLRETALLVSSSLELRVVLESILDQLGRVVPYDSGTIQILEPGATRVIAVRSLPAEEIGCRYPLDEHPYNHRLAQGEGPIVIEDVREGSEGWVIVERLKHVRANIGVSLQVGEQVIGILTIDSRQPAAYGEADARLAQIFAQQAAIAIRNASLYQQVRLRSDRLAAVNRISRAASSRLQLDGLVKTVYQELTSVFEAEALFIALYDDEAEELDFRLRIDRDVQEPPERRPLREGLTSLVVRERKALLIRNLEVERDGLPEPSLWGTMEAPQSWLGAPMLIEERVVGVISVQSYRPYAYDEEDRLLLSTIAEQVAVAVDNARLFEQERQQRDLAEALANAGAAVSGTLDLDQVIDRILEQVERVVGGDSFNVMLLDEGDARVVRRRGYTAGRARGRSPGFAMPIAEYPLLRRMAETGEAVVVFDTSADPDWIPLKNRKWLRSYVGAPVRLGEETVGFVNVNGTQPGQFTDDHARRLQAFADHIATAIGNARMYGQLENHAEELEERVEERTAEVRAQSAWLAAVLGATDAGLIATDTSGKIYLCNPVAHRWIKEALAPEDAARLRTMVQHLAAGAEERPRAVLELAGLDLELRASPVGEVEAGGAAVVSIHDVSHLKELDRVKSRFVSNVSHELRTPITTIKLYAHLMGQNPDRWQQYVDVLVTEADRQARLVEDILQVSRLDAGKLGLNPQSTPLRELTEIAVEGHRLLAESRGVSLHHEPADPAPLAVVDQQRVVQVLSNLVANAVHYTPEGGQIVVSTGTCEAEGKTWATATVADTGIGIPEDELPHLFERFFRGERVRQMQVPGTGLGLAIVKEIVALHGGRVTVESQVGEGSTFTVWLPVAE